MRIVQRIGPHSWRVLRDDERDQLKRERDAARAALKNIQDELSNGITVNWDYVDRRFREGMCEQ